jgi:hypothetical protein
MPVFASAFDKPLQRLQSLVGRNFLLKLETSCSYGFVAEAAGDIRRNARCVRQILRNQATPQAKILNPSRGPELI